MSPAALALLPPVDFQKEGPEQLVMSPRAAFRTVDLGMPEIVRLLHKEMHEERIAARKRFRPPRGRQLVIRQVLLTDREHPKGKSLSINKLNRHEKAAATERKKSLPIIDRPRTRAECEGAPRPCPWVSCRYHLYLDVARRAAHLNFPDLKPWEMLHSCALDVAEYGGVMLEEVGHLLNVTMERARQIEEDAIGKMKLYAESRPGSAFVRALEAQRSKR